MPMIRRSALTESTMEGQRMGEEVELLRVQLDAARKEASQQAMRAATVQVGVRGREGQMWGRERGWGEKGGGGGAQPLG